VSYADYLWIVADTLRRKVSGAVADEQSAAALGNCVNVLASLASSLERGDATPPDESTPPACAIRDAAGLPDSAAYQLRAAPFIDSAAERIRRGQADAAQTRQWVAWEAAQTDAAVRRMDAAAMVAGDAGGVGDGSSMIDRAALQAYLREAAGAPGLAIVQMRQAIGGRSRQTALFEVSDAPGLPARMVVQRGIPGLAKGAAFSGPEVEYRVVEAVHRLGMRVPRPLFLHVDPEPLGAPFAVMEQLRGRIVEPDYWAATASPALVRDLAEQMALLHAADPGTLAAILPQARTGSGPAPLRKELDELETAWRAQVHGGSVAMDAALAWLRANVGSVRDRRGLVHNDMVFHNILAEDDRITGILDWEQVAIGHPGEDLGYCYPVVSRVFDWEEFMAIYRAAGGPQVSRRETDYFALRALLRLVVLVQYGRDAFEAGRALNIVVAEAGAFFLQRLMQRLGAAVCDVLARDAAGEPVAQGAAA
jgi:aminoglycoside phosphotransferase (APT) family kinase protein